MPMVRRWLRRPWIWRVALLQKSPLAIAGIKHSITHARDHSVAEGLDQIATWNAGMLCAEDLMRAIQAKMSNGEAHFDDLLPDAD